MRELISVICTVKNGEQTITRTIESVLAQSYDKLEMIIVDDGSSDNTHLILKEYENKEDRIKVYYSGGIGRASALNKAIELASGKFIANIDADDLMHPQKLEIQMNFINEKDSVFLVATDSEFIYENENIIWDTINSRMINGKRINEMLLIRNQINHSSVLINKKKLIELGKYNLDRKTQLDYELWLKAYLDNCIMYKIDAKLTAKRFHENQAYENKKRLLYTFNSVSLQIKYILKSKKYIHFLPIPVLSFLLSQLPLKFRRVISKLIFRD